MILRSLKLENFRNYQNFTVDFKPISVFIGPNGIGKTNLIEAIYYLAFGKSYRVREDKDVIFWNKDFMRITGILDKDELEIFISAKPIQFKSVKINEIKSKIIELIGKLKIVIFSPESMEIITGSPKERRKFLDLILSQTDRDYLFNLMELQRVLKQRNKLLFGIKSGTNNHDELIFWDKKLVEISCPIIQKRESLINFINKKILGYYQKISADKKELKIKYLPAVDDINYYSDYLEKNREREIRESVTIFGPNRDNLDFLLEGKSITTFASRGEMRSAIFALKMIELDYFHFLGESPLLLLDDIFSELDEKRCGKLSEMILEYPTVITTTDERFLGKELKEKAKIIYLE